MMIKFSKISKTHKMLQVQIWQRSESLCAILMYNNSQVPIIRIAFAGLNIQHQVSSMKHLQLVKKKKHS